MKKIILFILSVLFSIGAVLLILFTALEITVFNENFFEEQLVKNKVEQTTGIEFSDLQVIEKHIFSYLKGETNDFSIQAPIHGELREVFNEKEIEHMVDVQNLFIAGYQIRNVCIILLIGILLVYIFYNKKKMVFLFNVVQGYILVIIALIAVFIALLNHNFNKYFTIFHEIFFTNDLWVLDPSKDVLIQIVPEPFFHQTALLIFIRFLIGLVSVLLVTQIYKILKKRYKWGME